MAVTDLRECHARPDEAHVIVGGQQFTHAAPLVASNEPIDAPATYAEVFAED